MSKKNSAVGRVNNNEVKKAREELWRMGTLEWKLKSHQKIIHSFFHEKKEKISVVNCSRQIGKSVTLAVLAIEQCILFPKSIVKLLQPKQNMIKRNFKPIMSMLLEDCPKDIRPHFNSQMNCYEFPNGSEIQLAGTDNGNADNIRGGKAHLCLIDEAGFCDDLNELISSILIPTTLQTGGKIVLCSTTSTDPNHDFIEQIRAAGTARTLMVMTIDDVLRIGKESGEEDPQIDEAKLATIVNSIHGGRSADSFRTEFLCEIITDSERAVVPEFNRNKKDIVQKEWKRPPFCDKYVAMDIGFKDLTVALFGFYDFENAVLVIEDEYVINGASMTTEKLAEGIRDKEHHVWRNTLTGEHEKPYLRVCDNNLVVINDLAILHNLYFIPTEKQNKDAALNQLKMMLNNSQIVILEKCQTLINHMTLATWDKTKKDYIRSKDNGHFDALDALVYMVRNINFSHNPYPKGYKYRGLGGPDQYHINHQIADELENAAYKKLASQFQVKTTLRKKTR